MRSEVLRKTGGLCDCGDIPHKSEASDTTRHDLARRGFELAPCEYQFTEAYCIVAVNTTGSKGSETG